MSLTSRSATGAGSDHVLRRPRGILSLLGTLYPIEHSRSLSNPYIGYCWNNNRLLLITMLRIYLNLEGFSRESGPRFLATVLD